MSRLTEIAARAADPPVQPASAILSGHALADSECRSQITCTWRSRARPGGNASPIP